MKHLFHYKLELSYYANIIANSSLIIPYYRFAKYSSPHKEKGITLETSIKMSV